MNRSVKDPVCGRKISSKVTAVVTCRYRDKIFHFCSERCRDKFSKKPSHYLGERRHRNLPPRTKLPINGMKGFHPYSAGVASRQH